MDIQVLYYFTLTATYSSVCELKVTAQYTSTISANHQPVHISAVQDNFVEFMFTSVKTLSLHVLYALINIL